jgi:2-polyprenyl-6-methoxyphenol hydroxylase-like FAD-dependent oxidoreductase
VREVLSATQASEVIWTDIFDVPPQHAYTHGRVVLLGDAAHAVTPDLGQGACQALEDAAVLPGLLARHPLDEALMRFDSQRRPRASRLVRDSAVSGASLKSAIPLRSRCAMPWFASYRRV